MILYEATDIAARLLRHDAATARTRRLTSRDPVFDTLAALLAERWSGLGRGVRCLEIATGAGDVLARLHELVADRMPEIAARSEFYGLDANRAAIDLGEQRFPELTWVVDSLPGFLDREEGGGAFDLIVDHSGLKFARSQAEYEQLLSDLTGRLADTGLYVRLQDKKQYALWTDKTCREWSLDAFDVNAAHLGEPQVLANDAAYVHVHAKPAAPSLDGASPLDARPKPRSVDFKLSDGTTESWFVSGDEVLRHRLRPLVSVRGAAPEALTALGSGGPLPRQEALLVELAEAGNRAGRPAVLDPGGWLFGLDGTRVRYQRALYKRILGAGFNVLHDPRRCDHVRRYVGSVTDWVAAQPDVVVLGCGLTDCRRDLDLRKPYNDLDLFRNLLDVVVDMVGQRSRVVWVDLEPAPRLVEAPGWTIDPGDAARYAQTAREVMEAHGVSVHELAVEFDPVDGRPLVAAFADGLAEAIASELAQAGAVT